ncbi:MAG: hypothetical protein ACM3MH_07120 [Actinomycetota bacterium]
MGSNPIGLTTSRVELEASDGSTTMVDDVEPLKARRAELERQIAALESGRIALYMPGITLIPQEGLPADDAADQQLAHLRAAIVEIDTQLGTLARSK